MQNWFKTNADYPQQAYSWQTSPPSCFRACPWLMDHRSFRGEHLAFTEPLGDFQKSAIKWAALLSLLMTGISLLTGAITLFT